MKHPVHLACLLGRCVAELWISMPGDGNLPQVLGRLRYVPVHDPVDQYRRKGAGDGRSMICINIRQTDVLTRKPAEYGV
jgi:hypothetical protein